jgi:F-type H+-transporting ATPase subunit gamma
MESVQNIKRRLKSVQNIGQITKAMELVAATKMRRSQELALNSRPYARAALQILGTLSKLETIKTPPILLKRPVKKVLFVVVSSDKGLAGSFNNSVFRETEKFFEKEKLDFKDKKNLFVAVGEKSRVFLERKGVNLIKTYIRVGDYTTPSETKSIADFLITGFLEGKWDKVTVFSMHFITALRQKVFRRDIFPIDFKNIRQAASEIIPATGRFSELANDAPDYFPAEVPREYLIEPSPEIVLNFLARHLVEMQFYHIILEANASEHAARRVAMKNASDNAEKLSSDLELSYNKSRQAAITQEIAEITAGAESLK